jgi:hypothetical protein
MEQQNEIKEVIAKHSAIESVANSKGGKIIIASLQKDITTCISDLSRGYRTMPHMELVAICARLSEQLAMLRVLNKAKKLKNLAKEELEFILKEE